MAMQISGKAGPQTLTDGSEFTIRGDKTGAQVVTDAHGRYTEATNRGTVFCAANQASQALSLFNATTYTGLCLTNPAGSGKNLAILEWCAYISAAITAVADIVLAANVNPVAAAVVQTTPLTVRPALLGGSASAVGLAASATTVPAAPVIVRSLFGWHWVTGGTPTAQLGVKDEIAGALIVAPGCSIGIAALTAAHSVVSSVTWEEIPV